MFMEEPLDEEDAEVCAGTFEALVVALARCVEEGRLSPPTRSSWRRTSGSRATAS